MPALGFKAHIVLLYIRKSVIFSDYISINIDKFPELFTQVFQENHPRRNALPPISNLLTESALQDEKTAATNLEECATLIVRPNLISKKTEPPNTYLDGSDRGGI